MASLRGVGADAALSPRVQGSTAEPEPTQIYPVEFGPELVHSVLCCTYAASPEAVLGANAAGFIAVKEVDMVARRVQVLAPSFEAFPSKVFVVGDLKWME